MPAKGGFSSDFAKQLFDRYSTARDIFTRAANYYHLNEAQFFELFDKNSDKKSMSIDQNRKQFIRRNGALITIYVALYRILDEQYNVSVKPFGIMGNSIGVFSAFIAAGAIDLEDGLNLFNKFCEVSLKTAGGKTFYRMRVKGIPLPEVERLVVSPGSVEVQHVHHHTHLSLKEEVTLIGEIQALLDAKSKIEREHGSERVEMLGVDMFAPFHTPMLREGSEELERYVSHLAIKNPNIKVFSSSPGKGILETAEDVRWEIVYTLSHPIRWDSMVENAATNGANKFIVLGREGNILKTKIHKGPQEVELIPLGNIESVRWIKRYILNSLGTLEEFDTPVDLFDFIYYFVLNGAKRLAFDGFSGAGKSVFIEGLAEYLKTKGHNVVMLHAGNFIRSEELSSLRNKFRSARGNPKISLNLTDLINYDQFLDFIKKVIAIQNGSEKDEMVHLSGLYDENTHTNQGELDVPITENTILVCEGNLFINGISESWFDITFFIDLDLTTDLDLERILERARKRGKSGSEIYYRDDVSFYRRPLVRLHREINARFFDFFLDNTVFTTPVLVQNPMKVSPRLNLRAIVSSYQSWRTFSTPVPQRLPTSDPDIDSSV